MFYIIASFSIAEDTCIFMSERCMAITLGVLCSMAVKCGSFLKKSIMQTYSDVIPVQAFSHLIIWKH